MKVLMISKAMIGGAYHNKLEELSMLGVELHLVAPASWGNHKLEVNKADMYDIHPLEIFLTGKNHFHFYRGLAEIINDVKPDIMHIDEEHYSFVTFQAMRLAKKINAKALFFTWQNIYKRYPFPFSFIEQYNFNSADVALAGNEEARDVLRRKGFKKEIAVIPQLGVDPDIFKKANGRGFGDKISFKDGRFIIGYIGRLVEEKGILKLIEAVSEAPVNSMLLILGSGPLKKEISAAAEKYGIGGRVEIIDRVASGEIPSYLNRLDCLVLPSLTTPGWKEQFGRVLIEAMACEVPVIGSSSGEIPRVINDAGLIFREGDIGELKKKINELMNNAALRSMLGQRGRERVLRNYTQKKIALETFNVYKNLIGN
ncbi:MAG: glycosyltransferase family 4 protein [Nitrospirae bacterium]|nr:glycosyltransferase family 4 protein [Nitrospirota bacterium]